MAARRWDRASVVSNHRRLHNRLDTIEAQFESSILNHTQGNGPLGIVAAGVVYCKLLEALGGSCPSQASILQLSTFNPFPRQRVLDWLCERESVLVLEETAPLVERAVRAIAQQAGLVVPIYGRDTGHVVPAGELLAPQIAQTLDSFDRPDLGLRTQFREEETGRPMPSTAPPAFSSMSLAAQV